MVKTMMPRNEGYLDHTLNQVVRWEAISNSKTCALQAHMAELARRMANGSDCLVSPLRNAKLDEQGRVTLAIPFYLGSQSSWI
jgi:hypothetical protein